MAAAEEGLLSPTNHVDDETATTARNEGRPCVPGTDVDGGGMGEGQSEEASNEREASLDGGWGWMVCLGSFITNFIVFGIHNSFGVIYSTLVEQLGISSAQTAWIGSLGMGLNFLCGPVSSALCERIGGRLTALAGATLAVSGLLLTSFITQKDVSKMYGTYSLMFGVASSFCYVSSMVMLGQYFDKRMALANGLGASGSGLGTLMMAPVIQKLLSTLGWRTTFRFLSGLSSLLFIAAWLYRPLPGKNTKHETTPHPCVDLNIWRNKAFIVWVLSISFFLFGYFIPFIHLVRLARILGVNRNDAAMLMSYMSIASTVSRVLFGKIGDLRRVNRLLMFQVAILIIGTSTALLSLAQSHVALIMYAVIFGFFDGCFIGQVAVVTSHIVGVKHLGVALGYLFGAIALPMTFGPPVAGWIYDAFQSYNAAFYAAGCTSFVGFLMMFLIPRFVKKYADNWEKQFDLKRRASIDSRRKLVSNTLSDFGPAVAQNSYDDVFADEANAGKPLTQVEPRPTFNTGRRRSLPALYVSNNSPSMRHSSGDKVRLSSRIPEPTEGSPPGTSVLNKQTSIEGESMGLSRSGSSLQTQEQAAPPNRMRGRRGSLPVISLSQSTKRSAAGALPAQVVFVNPQTLAQKGIPLVNGAPMASRNKRRGSLPAINHPSPPPRNAPQPKLQSLGKRRGSLPLVSLQVPEYDEISGRRSNSRTLTEHRCSTGCIDELDEEGHAEHTGDNEGHSGTRGEEACQLAANEISV